MKFGGASVAHPAQFAQIAEIIANRHSKAHVVVVVSAMGDTTNQLLSLARQVHPSPPPRELDMLLTTGERVSIALLAMALHSKGKDAISFTGSQSGIITTPCHFDARIIDVRPHRLQQQLDLGKVVIVAGFQGVSTRGEITTLGRGGSDTTAVALAVALGASCVEFYKDVPGICSDDPKMDPSASVFPYLSYDEALAVVLKGAKVLHPRCIQLAAQNGVNLHVRSFFDVDLKESLGTRIGLSRPGPVSASRGNADFGKAGRACCYEIEEG
ncbi:MAG: aspartate kinase [Rhabdochlamydiaceae bacterium]|nr:aspartate kinase [Rhabdochlamydiaceae bacterium]